MAHKSAKDLAFDRERLKYRKEINELKTLLKQKNIDIYEAKERASKLEIKCEELQDWVNRLLEYMDMSEEDIKKILQREKDTDEFIKLMNRFFGLPRSFF